MGSSATTSELFPNHAVRWDRRGRITDLGTLPGSDPTVESSASGINRHGTVIGYSGFNVPVFWDRAGRITELHGLDGGRYGTVLALNDKGFAVGTSSTGPTLWRLPR